MAKWTERRQSRNDRVQMRGLSRSNLMAMRAFADAWPDEEIVQQVVGQLPWGHNVDLIHRHDRLFYAARAIEHGWSRRVLQARIASRLHAREGQAITNFSEWLPAGSAERHAAGLRAIEEAGVRDPGS